MKRLGFRRYALCSCVAAAMLAGCGGSQPPIGAPGVMQQIFADATHADRGKSWMRPEAKNSDLLYVSANITGEIYIFSYPKGGLVGTLSGLTSPAGLCVDRSGDVWAVTSSSSGAGTLIEYAHGGTSPIATLSVPGTRPYGCGVDPKTGNLAVTNSGDSVSIFSNASGSPTTYTAAEFYNMYYCGYDSQGNLYADGNSQSGAQLAELAKGGDSLENVTINATLNHPGAVQWDGKYLAVAELSSHSSGQIQIYRVKVNGSEGTVAATVTLLGKHFLGGFQGWIQGGTYVQPNKQSDTEGLWNYPKGGKTIKNITTAGAEVLWGATVSLAK